MSRINAHLDGTYYQLSGKAEAPVLTLIHGLGLDLSTWDPYIESLSQNYRVLCYDLSGHGQSIGLTTPSLTGFGQQLVALLDGLTIAQTTLIGFSLGGMINRRVAIDAPQRITSLIILNSPHEREPAQQALVEQQALAANSGGVAANIDAIIERWFSPEFRANSPQAVTKIREGVLRNEPNYYAQTRFVLAQGVVELIRPIPAIDRPTLVITCENDSGSTPKMSQAIAAEIVNAELHIVPGLKHMGLLEAPQQFLALIFSFLARIDDEDTK